MGDRARDGDPGPGARPALARARLMREQRARRIEEEIDLYCNPFVEVYCRLAGYAWLTAQSWAARAAELEVGANPLWRGVRAVADFTVC